ncbi:HET domain-containing protein [Microdochium nivale]|nr:HET domain-containing protein [Microdochium nivale]
MDHPDLSGLYSPIDSSKAFRLLRLLPGDSHAPIECQLIPADLDHARGTFEAASYTWGSPEDQPLIQCNGVAMSIQRNAFAMLRAFRLPRAPRLLWVDAICIDQSNLDERAQQVAIMNQIYEGPKQVTIWLGEADESSRKALQFASTLDIDLLKQELGSQISSLGPKSKVEQAQAMQSKSFFFDRLDALDNGQAGVRDLAMHIGNFLMRPYFGRVWIQQEVRLAPDVSVQCGSYSCSWDYIWALAWIMLPRRPGLYPDFADDLYTTLMGHLGAVYYVQVHRLRGSKAGKSAAPLETLFDQLDTFRNLSATNPRDKVYALLNLVCDGNTWVPPEKISYKIPWELLYLAVAKDALTCGATIVLENAGRARQEPGTSCPSWMPDYRQQYQTDYIIQKQVQWRPDTQIFLNRLHTKKQLTKTPFCKVQPLPKGQRRRVQVPDDIRTFKGPEKSLFQSYVTTNCYMMDEIIYVGKTFDGLSKSIPVRKRIAMNAEEDMAYVQGLPFTEYLSGESTADAFKLTCMLGLAGNEDDWRSTTRDTHDALKSGHNIAESWEDWVSWMHQAQGDPYQDVGDSTTHRRSKRPVLFDAATASQYGFHFCFAVTENGYFCLVPGISQAGDHIAIISGYTMPLVVRASSSQTSGSIASTATAAAQNQRRMRFFEFIGDSYVHGAMEGEIHNIMGVIPCKHEATPAQRAKVEAMLRDEKYDAWHMLDLSKNYERVVGTIGTRELHLI